MKNANFFIRFNSGLILGLSIALVSFEWKSFETSDFRDAFDREIVYMPIDDDMIPITVTKAEPPPPPPKVNKPQFKVVQTITEPVTEPFIEEPNDEIEIPPFVEPEIIPEENHPRPHAEVQPEFPGGLKELYKYLGEEIIYDERCKEAGLEGTVFVYFEINESGKPENIKLAKGIGCKFVEDQVLEAIAKMPSWTPGKQNGREVSVYFNLPVRFSILR